MPRHTPHVALLIETSRSYARDMLRGIRHYISAHGPWSVYVELRSLESPVPPWLANWRGQGIITRTANQRMADAITATGLPAVELRASKLRHSFPFVGVNNKTLGQWVAQHLLERGFQQFAVVELTTETFFEERRDNFVATLRERGYPCDVFSTLQHRETPEQWEAQQAKLARWVARLPKPVGIMACTDQLGVWLLDACSRAKVSVPDEVAVVGVENEELLCTVANPPLTSVAFNGERIGYEAAALLDRMMRGEPAPKEPILIDPLTIVTRQSSEVVATDDATLVKAMRFIRENACRGITVEDVLEHVHISRSALERRMLACTGRSPKTEILNVRLNHVKQLLHETDLSLAQIAERTGFKHPQYMSHVFKVKTQQTPGQYRQSIKPPRNDN